MSIELWVYSPDPPLDREVLVRTCALMEDEKRWQIAFQPKGNPPVVDADGPLISQLVHGWIPGGAAETEIRAALQANDRAAIEDLYASGVLATVGLKVRTRRDGEWEDIVATELETAPPRHRDEIRHAATIYTVETGATRNEISLEFQVLFFRALGVMSNGLMVDPQEHEFISTIQEIGRDGEKGDAALAVQEAQARRDEPPGYRAASMLTAAVVLLILVELASAILFFPQYGWMTLFRDGVPILALAALWSLVREGDTQGYWILVLIAAVIPLLAVYHLPGAHGAHAVWLLVRIVIHGLATLLLLLPASRRYGTRASDEAYAGS